MRRLLMSALVLLSSGCVPASGPQPVEVPDSSMEPAVRSALEWLARHQAPDGHWGCAGFDACCRGGMKCAGPGDADYDVGATSLALLAFLGHGETSGVGSFQDTMRRGLSWLKGQQAADGCVGPKHVAKRLYNHVLATQVLAEAVGMGERRFQGPAQKAVKYLLVCQNPKGKGGGWRYFNYNLPGTPHEADGDNDTSMTCWAVLALQSARMAGLTVPNDAFERASLWLDSVYEIRADGKGIFGYLRKANGKLGLVHASPYTTTSMGVFVRLLLGQNAGVQEGTWTLLERLPDWKHPDLYGWHWVTLALFQVGGEPWKAWNAPLKEVLCRNQEIQGCQEGSWDPAQDTWGGEGGRVCTTALGALCLEVLYRYKKGIRIPGRQEPYTIQEPGDYP